MYINKAVTNITLIKVELGVRALWIEKNVVGRRDLTKNGQSSSPTDISHW